MKSKAMVLRKDGSIDAEEIEIPEPTGNQRIVKVKACGFCGTDDHFIRKPLTVPSFKAETSDTLVPGHEICGEVVGTGEQVIVPAVFCCGECEMCRSGRQNMCLQGIMLGRDWSGGMAQYVLVPDGRQLCVLPDSIAVQAERIGFEVQHLCVVADAMTTAFHAVFRRSGIKPADRVAVIGCGGVGLNVIQMCVAAHAIVVGLDSVAEKTITGTQPTLPVRFGAVRGICTSREGDAKAVFKAIKAGVRKALGGDPDIVFEVVGHPDAYLLAHGLTKRGGTLVTVGYTEQTADVPIGHEMAKELDKRGTFGCSPWDYPRVLHMVCSGSLDLAGVVTGTFGFDNFREAMAAQSNPATVRSIIVPPSE